MKKIILTLSFAVVGLLPSCGDILDILPVDNQSAEEFYATKEEVAQGLAGIYARLGRYNTNDDFPTTHMLILSESRSDNWYLAQNPNAQRDQADLRRYAVLPTTGVVETSFNRLYSMIEGVNSLVTNHNVAEKAGEYKQTIAEARFLRGYAYFELARTWGPVPIVLEPIEKTEAPAYPRSPIAEVYAQVIADLTFARDNLDPMPTGANAGHVGSWAARTMLAYAYVTMAGYPLNDATAYGKAVAELQPVIDQLAPRFAPSYPQIFSVTEENTWDLFSVQFIADNKGSGSSLMGYETSNGFRQWNTRQGQGQDMRVDSLLVLPMMAENDARGQFPIIIDGYWNLEPSKVPPRPHTDEDIANGNYVERPHQLIKYLVDDPNNDMIKAWNDSPLNFPLLRVSDAYLLYAEALIGTGGAGAKDWIDKVRVRAGIAPLTAEPTMADLFDERRREFVGEGKRYFDLVRQGETVFVNTLKAFTEHYEQNSTYGGILPTTKDMLLPIPQPVMNQQDGWEQNPGYN